MRHIVIVMSNPVEGKENEYNDWYENTHVDEVLQVQGIATGQRFRVNDADANGQRYAAVYEIDDDDLDLIMKRVAQAAPNWVKSDAFDTSTGKMLLLSPIGPQHRAKQ